MPAAAGLGPLSATASDPGPPSDRLEQLERLPAAVAEQDGLAGGRSEFAPHGRVDRTAIWAGHRGATAQRHEIIRFDPARWRDPVGLQLGLRLVRHPVGGPRRRVDGLYA